MEALLDNAPCGFLVVSDAGVVTAINNTLVQWLGYDSDELLGKKMEVIMGIAGRIFYQTHLFPLITLHRKAEEIFITLKTKHKTDFPVLLNGKRVEQHDAVENHYVLMPVFQRKKFEDELVRARNVAEDAILQNEALQKAKAALELSKAEQDSQVTRLLQMHSDLANFSKVISHDMQEPARKIAVFTDIIINENNPNLTSDSKNALPRILKASHHLRGLISCLEQYVGIDMATETITRCDLAHVIEAARQQLFIEIPDAQIDLVISPLPEIEGHCEQLTVLFYHLLSNAVHFKNPEDARAMIRIEADIIQQNSYKNMKDKYRYVDYVRVMISDNGIGFDNQYKEYIFQLFKKAHKDTDGLGFGLALCKKIVEHHKGSIWGQSRIDQSTTFTILLPLRSG